MGRLWSSAPVGGGITGTAKTESQLCPREYRGPKSSVPGILAHPSREASGRLGLSALVIAMSLESAHMEPEIGDKAK